MERPYSRIPLEYEIPLDEFSKLPPQAGANQVEGAFKIITQIIDKMSPVALIGRDQLRSIHNIDSGEKNIELLERSLKPLLNKLKKEFTQVKTIAEKNSKDPEHSGSIIPTTQEFLIAREDLKQANEILDLTKAALKNFQQTGTTINKRPFFQGLGHSISKLFSALRDFRYSRIHHKTGKRYNYIRQAKYNDPALIPRLHSSLSSKTGHHNIPRDKEKEILQELHSFKTESGISNKSRDHEILNACLQSMAVSQVNLETVKITDGTLKLGLWASSACLTGDALIGVSATLMGLSSDFISSAEIYLLYIGVCLAFFFMASIMLKTVVFKVLDIRSNSSLQRQSALWLEKEGKEGLSFDDDTKNFMQKVSWTRENPIYAALQVVIGLKKEQGMVTEDNPEGITNTNGLYYRFIAYALGIKHSEIKKIALEPDFKKASERLYQISVLMKKPTEILPPKPKHLEGPNELLKPNDQELPLLGPSNVELFV